MANRGYFMCSNCNVEVYPQWKYCASCGVQLISSSSHDLRDQDTQACSSRTNSLMQRGEVKAPSHEIGGLSMGQRPAPASDRSASFGLRRNGMDDDDQKVTQSTPPPVPIISDSLRHSSLLEVSGNDVDTPRIKRQRLDEQAIVSRQRPMNGLMADDLEVTQAQTDEVAKSLQEEDKTRTQFSETSSNPTRGRGRGGRGGHGGRGRMRPVREMLAELRTVPVQYLNARRPPRPPAVHIESVRAHGGGSDRSESGGHYP